MSVNLPTNLLRNFVAIVDAGSMLNAADQVFVTQSALSLQVKRLEDMLQQALFVREGRKLHLTTEGTVLLDYARRLLALHDEAVIAVNQGRFHGPIRIGMVQDVAETLLSGVLTRFAKLHPEAQIYGRVAGTLELLDLLQRGGLDVVIGYAAADDPNAIRTTPMRWFGRADPAADGAVPLAVLEPPCRFREAAIAALEAGGIPYRITVETPNLSTLRAAVEAGMGLTCRTHLFLPQDSPRPDAPLPALPDVAFIVRHGSEPSDATERLVALAGAMVREL
jgi:DNA-binding transcriptional LysR family regulator